MRIVVLLICFFGRLAVADTPPSGYACGDGKVIKGKGCGCTPGKMPARDGENTAICIPRPVAETKQEPTACLSTRTGQHSLAITAVPSSVPLYLGDKSCGAAAIGSWTGKLTGSPVYVIIAAPGFDDVRQLVDPVKQSSVRIEFSSWAVLDVSSADSKLAGARVSVDGTEAGVGDVKVVVKPGRHTVRSTGSTGVRSAPQTVDVRQSQQLKVYLAAIVEGTLKVSSTIPDAEVFLDGTNIGKVPLEKPASPGQHVVTVKAVGYSPFEQKVQVDAGNTVTVVANLVRLETNTAKIVGHIVDARSQGLAGATVVATSPKLTGHPSAISDELGDFSLAGLPAGSYTLDFYYADITVTRKVEVADGATLRVSQTIRTK